jgi:uncharacterized protein DUF5666
MFSNSSRLLSISVAAALLAACGGGSGGGSSNMTSPPPATPQNAGVAMLLSDASTEDWATIGVKVLSIALVPQGGGSNVPVYTAPSVVPITNLVQLDNIAELLGTATVPVGTYTGAVLTVSGNASDILLVVSAEPETGFAAAAGTTIPTSQIQVQHTQGSAGNLTTPINIAFVSPLVVSSTANNAVDLEFELSHPAFLVGHVPVGGGDTIWAVNFDGPVHHHPLHDLTRLVLRHMYGDVTAVSSQTITITKEYPTEPPSDPETAVSGTQSLQISADGTNGTIFYDVDAGTRTVIDNFDNEDALVGKYVRVAARYQENGTLVATRIWASSKFNSVWVSPEGHVLHVNAADDVITVENESGHGVAMNVDSNTQFFFREPQNPAVDSKPIATGTAFLKNEDLVRGFKVHATVVDILATPLVAQSIDIETAQYDGTISSPNTTDFTYTRKFHTVTDNYRYTLNYINNDSANGDDMSGNAITGYEWWNFAYPTVLTCCGMDAISDFVSATDGSVNFGGAVGPVPSRGVSYATWNDPATAGGWAAAASILMPSTLPLGHVETGLTGNGSPMTFTMTATGGTMPITVDVSTTSGSATLVYQVDRTNGVVTVSPIDITTSTGLADLTLGLAAGAPVKVYGTPQATALKAYVLVYFTGDLPAAQ